MKCHKYILVLATLLLSITACNRQSQHDDDNIKIVRYEQLLFETPYSKLPEKLVEFRNSYPSPLLIIKPEIPQFLEQLQGFVSDSVVRDIYNITEKRYKELFWLEKEITDALEKAQKLDNEIVFEHFASFVSVFFDYNQRILVDRDSRSVLISIDQYALNGMEKYHYFELPMFIVQLSDSAYIASDIMAEIARQFIAFPEENSVTMLDYMIMEGKVLYFLDQVMPNKADNVKIRYSSEQLDWCKRNESMIWAYFIQHNLLYEKDHARYHNFIDEAPHTNAFKDSAPRTTQYIGWQIVRQYMKNNKCSLKELFENSNSQSILQSSGYKP